MGILFLVTSIVKQKDCEKDQTEERFQQTIHTIQTIKKKVPDAIIVVLEASHGCKTLVMFADVFMFYIDHELIDNPNSQEATILQIFLNSDCYKNLTHTTNYMVFKISGRYFLNDHFDFAKFHPYKINCRIIDAKNDPNDTHYDVGHKMTAAPDICAVTYLFSFPSEMTDFILKRLQFVLDCSEKHHIFKHVSDDIIHNTDVIGISGTQSATGRFVAY